MGLGLFRDLAIKSVIKGLFSHQPIATSGLRIPVINSVLSIFSIYLALPFFPLQQALTAESKNRMGTDKIQGQSRWSMYVGKSSLTFSQSVINCTCLCSCRYFYHMIFSSHMSALPKFDFSCDLWERYPYFTSTLISVQPGNGLLAHEYQLTFRKPAT